MKLGILKSVGHNMGHSMASGIGLMVGLYQMDVFGEAAASPEGYIEIDFLTGAVSGAAASPALRQAARSYAGALPDICHRHRIAPNEFQELKARFSRRYGFGNYVVTVEDRQGRRSVDEYEGMSGARLKVLDHLGRIRPKRLVEDHRR